MTGSVEGAKDIGADKPAEAAKEAGATPAPVAVGVAAASTKASSTKASLADTLSRRVPIVRIDSRMAMVAGLALAAGAGFGLLAAPRGHSGEALVRIEAGLEAGRTEAARLNTEIEQLARSLAAIRETGEAARGESKSLGTSLTERLARMEQGLDRKFAALSEKTAPGDRETGTPLAAATPVQAEKRAATPVAVAAATTPAAAPTAPARPEPTQTASISEPKPRTETIEAWALREVYDGVAMLEDRKRRLVEVGPGDSVPGVGRVEAIERRGRNWVVVTRQGLITPQMW